MRTLDGMCFISLQTVSVSIETIALHGLMSVQIWRRHSRLCERCWLGGGMAVS